MILSISKISIILETQKNKHMKENKLFVKKNLLNCFTEQLR